MKESVVNKRESKIFMSLILTFLSKGGAAFGAFFLLLVIGRVYGSEGVGVFSILQGVSLIFATVARFGTGGALVRYVAKSEDHESGGYLVCAMRLSLWLSVVMSLLFWISKGLLERVYDYDGMLDLLPGMVAALLPITVSGVLSGYFKGVYKPVLASALENGVISIIAVLLLLLGEFFLFDVGLSGLGWIYAISAWLVCIGGMFGLGVKRYSVIVKRKLVECDASFLKASKSFLVIHLAVLVNSLVGLVVAGLFLNADELGQLRVAHQLATFINFILIVIDMVFPPRYAALYQDKNMSGLEELGRRSVVYGLAVAVPLFIILVVFRESLLNAFGEGFAFAGSALVILALGQLFNVATGSVGFILNMTGHVNIMRNITLFTSLLGLVLIVVMTSVFGLVGAAIALALAVVIQNAMAYLSVCRKLNLRLWGI